MIDYLYCIYDDDNINQKKLLLLLLLCAVGVKIENGENGV